ncbi:hypothetical protein PLCT2_01229 [Planctomycetaceae bacterium]|nr:hypothetical protein PLCT2_01229 [Planctomycetaceae bacterium]
MFKLIRFVSFVVLACGLLGMAAFNTAQDAPAQPLETESRTGIAVAARNTAVNVDLKGYGGEVRIKSIVAPGTLVKEGEAIASVEAPELAEELQNAQAVAQAARNKAAWCEHNLKWEAKLKDVRLARAKLGFESAKAALEEFLAVGKADRITGADLGLRYNQDSIEDQEDELRQLDALYKGNDLAKESQDIVIKRAKRRLEQSRVRLKLVQNDYDRLVKSELPREEQNLKLNLENAKHDYESAVERNTQGLSESLSQCIFARLELEGAEKRLQRLLDARQTTEIKAPHAGMVLHAGDAGQDGITATILTGQKISNGQTIAWVLDTSTLRITVGIDPRAVRLAKMQRNTAKVEVKELGISLEARVVGLSSVVKDDKVAAIFEVTPADSGLMHGCKVQLTLSANK